MNKDIKKNYQTEQKNSQKTSLQARKKLNQEIKNSSDSSSIYGKNTKDEHLVYLETCRKLESLIN